MKPSIAWALVGMQFGLIAALVVVPYGGLWPRGSVAIVLAIILVGGGLGVIGLAGVALGRALTPSPIPREGVALVTSGVYRAVRHPMYTGVLLAAAGAVVWGASLGHIIGWAALYVVLSIKAAGEESMLALEHEGYDAWAKRSGRLIPKLSRKRP